MRKDDNHWDAVGKNDWRTQQEIEMEQSELDYSILTETAVLKAILAGAERSGDIHKLALQHGLPPNCKNIFPALDRLERKGEIRKKYATRPIQWLAVEKAKAIPKEQLPTGLMLMMGYTNIEPVGARKVSPLELYYDHDYKEMPNDAIGTKRREVHIGCSMSKFSNFSGD